jgi:ABC-type sugar transport system ATPase subunit
MSTVEHEDLARLCSRVYVMHAGRCRRVIQHDDLSPHRLAEAVYSA